MRCSTTSHVHCIACSIFSRELETLRAAERVECSIPLPALEEVSQFTGLPWEVVCVSLDHLSKAIEEATKGLVTDAA